MIQKALSLFAACGDTSLFSIPPWHKYLDGTLSPDNGCSIQFNSIYDTFLVLAALIEIVLRVGILIAVAMIIFGGFKFIFSQGDPNSIAGARDSIIHAIIGLIIMILATTIISFIAGRF